MKTKEKTKENNLKEFYKNWYFFTEYKDKEHYKDAHKIKYN